MTQLNSSAQLNVPIQLDVKMGSGCLELTYANGKHYQLSFEFLRVHSPSAEVRGHGAGSEVLQFGKKRVTIQRIEPVGNYAIKIIFSDKHDSGLFTWPLLHDFCLNQQTLWQAYLEKLSKKNLSRDQQ